MLGRRAIRHGPFFWTTHTIHLKLCWSRQTWDELDLDGSIEEHDSSSHSGAREDARRATIGRDARAWKANSPWRQLSRLIEPENRLRHIAAARKGSTMSGSAQRCRSTRGDHAGASRPASGVSSRARQGIVCSGTFRASAEARAVSRALHLQGQAVPPYAFSNSSGIPTYTMAFQRARGR